MSPRPPLLSGRELVKIYERRGYRKVSQEGSLIRNDETGAILITPDHKEVDRWTFKTILKQAEISEEEFREYL